MNEERNKKKLKKEFEPVYRLAILTCAIVGLFAITLGYFVINPEATLFGNENTNEAKVATTTQESDDYDKIENGIHVRTGFVDAPGMMETVQNCTNCHSAKLVMQNRMNKERWKSTIKWMQETQNLWDLGKNEEIIIDYLVTNYPPKKKGRREVLTDIEWYELK